MNKSRMLVLSNTVTLFIMLAANYGVNAGVFTNVTVGEVSNKYDTLFAPAGYAFSIWGLIFLFCSGFVAFQWKLLKENDPRQYIQRTGVWFTISNIANIAWLYCWTKEMLGLSVILILILLISLCIITVKLRLELDDEPVRTIVFIWWPVTFYLGWIMVATIACIAAWLVYLGWNGGTFGDDVYTIIMIGVACILYLLLLRKRNMREAALVGIWAFVAIAVRQWNVHINISYAAIMASVILLITTLIHGYKNRSFSPVAKMSRGEWK